MQSRLNADEEDDFEDKRLQNIVIYIMIDTSIQLAIYMYCYALYYEMQIYEMPKYNPVDIFGS